MGCAQIVGLDAGTNLSTVSREMVLALSAVACNYNYKGNIVRPGRICFIK